MHAKEEKAQLLEGQAWAQDMVRHEPQISTSDRTANRSIRKLAKLEAYSSHNQRLLEDLD